MSELKPGDRVRVEFEGTVKEVRDGFLRGRVVRLGQAFGPYFTEYTFPLDVCTLIEPEIVLPEIPGTIVQVDPLNEHDELVAYEYDSLTGDGWYRAGRRGSCTTDEVVGMCRAYGYRVIPAATEEVENV